MDAHASHEKNLNINAIQENKNITKYLIVLGKVYLLKKYLKEIVEATPYEEKPCTYPKHISDTKEKKLAAEDSSF